MWEWFLPASERHKYYSQIMEGPHGGGSTPLPEKTAGWLWGFLFGAATAFVVSGIAWVVL